MRVRRLALGLAAVYGAAVCATACERYRQRRRLMLAGYLAQLDVWRFRQQIAVRRYLAGDVRELRLEPAPRPPWEREAARWVDARRGG